jgi:hypothetical protein
LVASRRVVVYVIRNEDVTHTHTYIYIIHAGASVHEAIDALVRDLLRGIHQREQESRNRAASKLVVPAGRKCEVDREADCASDSGSGARSRESTAAISRENTVIVTTLATTTPPARTHVGGGNDEPKASMTTPARQTAQDHAAVMPAAAVDDVPEGAAKEAEAKQQRDDQVRKSRIVKYERKIAQIRVRAPTTHGAHGAHDEPFGVVAATSHLTSCCLVACVCAGAGGRVLSATAR